MHTATTSTLMAYAALVGTVEAERNVAASIVLNQLTKPPGLRLVDPSAQSLVHSA